MLFIVHQSDGLRSAGISLLWIFKALFVGWNDNEMYGQPGEQVVDGFEPQQGEQHLQVKLPWHLLLAAYLQDELKFKYVSTRGWVDEVRFFIFVKVCIKGNLSQCEMDPSENINTFFILVQFLFLFFGLCSQHL